MPDIIVDLSDSEVKVLSRCADRRDIDSIDIYIETLLTQFVIYMQNHGRDQEVDEDVESKLKDLGYL